MKLSIIIPTFNEERTIQPLLEQLLATPMPVEREMIIIDDHSTDSTYSIERQVRRAAASLPIRILRNRTNQGKGACIRQGLKHATGDLIIVQDGDLEYDPRDIPKLLDPVLKGRAQVVFGSRFLLRRRPTGMAWPNYVANRLLTGFANLLYGRCLSDLYSCYKLFPVALLASCRIRARRFEFEPEVLAKLTRRRIEIMEVPIDYHGRTKAQGKKIALRDFWIGLRTLLRYRFGQE